MILSLIVDAGVWLDEIVRFASSVHPVPDSSHLHPLPLRLRTAEILEKR